MPVGPMIGAAAKGAKALYNFGKGAKAATEFLFTLGKQVDDTAKKMIHMADAIGGRWVEMNDLAFKTARTMAMSREQAMRYNQQLLKSTKELAAQYGITAKELDNFQKSYSQAIGRNIVLTREQMAHMSAFAKITDEATAAQLVDDFDKIGIGIAGALANVGHMQEKAKAFGVNATKATQNLKDNIKLASTYSFKNGVADIESMVLKSTALRANMEAIMRSSEKFSTIEGALETSAKLQMLGGNIGLFGANPMGNMYNAMADPKKYQDDLLNTVKSLVTYDKKTGETSMNPLQAQFAKAMADALGMQVSDLIEPAYAQIKNEAVLRQLGTKAESFSPEQREAIQNLARGNFNTETGKYQVTWMDKDGEHTKNVEDLSKEELKIAQDSQATEENMRMDVKDIKTILERVHGRARETKSVKEAEEGIQSWWDAQVTSLQNIYMPFVSGLYNDFSNWLGKQYFTEGGIVKPVAHAAEGTIIPGSSYYGDKVPAMVNSGEMVINQKQQKGLFSLISSLALNGGAMYGMNKLGARIGYGGLGSTMLLANVLGDGKTDAKSLIEAHFIMKAVKSMKPLSASISEIGKVSATASESTSLFSSRWKDLTSTLSRDFSSAAKKMSTAARTYLSTGRWGKVTRGTSKIASSIASKASHYGGITAAHAKTIGEWIGRYTIKPIAKGAKWLANTKPVIGARGWAEMKYLRAKLGYKDLVKPKAQEYSKLIKNLFDTGSSAQASKAASRLQTPEIAMTGKHTGVSKVAETASKEVSSVAKTATQEASTVAKAAGNGGKILSNLGKVSKIGGKLVKPLAAVGAIAGIVSDVSTATSQYDKQIDDIERSGMSDREKARAKDRATKQKNVNIGGSVGKNTGAVVGGFAGMAKGAALGSLLGPVGTIAGGLIGGLVGGFAGDKLGGLLGKGVGSLFGGNEEKKYIEEQKEKEYSIAKPIAGDNNEIVKILKSIDGKMPIAGKVTSSFGLKSIGIAETGIKALFDISKHVAIKATDKASDIVGRVTGTGKNDINLNISGTIKLEGGNKSANLDIAKLLDTPEFKRQIAEMVSRRLNEVSNAGKARTENTRNNVASTYNK